MLRDAPLPIVAVCGFPFGLDVAETKASSAARAAADGASEIDMAMNCAAMLSGETAVVRREIAAVRAALPGKTLKVILETARFSASALEEAAKIAVGEGADFLKTSTGFGPRGATVEDVRLLARFGKVKASGGIRTREEALALVAAGASRLGTSRTREVLCAS
jgi:deoxyribose-phosphate aldolase